MPSSHLIFCCPLLLLPPIPPSIRVFSNESTLHMRWPKYWSLNILRHCLSLGLEWKLIFSSPVATTEFSQFAGILSAALSQHHLSVFTNIGTHSKRKYFLKKQCTFSFIVCFLFIKLVSYKCFILGMQCLLVFITSSLKILITMLDIYVIRMDYCLTDWYKIGSYP